MLKIHYPRFKSLEGKYYRDKSHYGGTKDYWFIYTKIVEIKESDVYEIRQGVTARYRGWQFQTDSYGNTTINKDIVSYVHSLGNEITEDEFIAGWNKMVDGVASSRIKVMSKEKFKLPRTKQCAKCPWKVSTNPYDIPDGYCEIKHANLKETISQNPLDFLTGNKKMNVMACHHSDGNDQMYCIGWLKNQLGVGNNIRLRMQMGNCENIRELKVVGKQHERFEDTLPQTQNIYHEP